MRPNFNGKHPLKRNARRFVRLLLRGSRAGLEEERRSAAVRECLSFTTRTMLVVRGLLEGKYGLRPAAFALPLTVEGMRAVNADVDAAELVE